MVLIGDDGQASPSSYQPEQTHNPATVGIEDLRAYESSQQQQQQAAESARQVINEELPWPTESKRIKSAFDPVTHPLGIDIGAKQQGVAGDVIRAVEGGTVTTAGFPSWSPSGSSYVIITGADGREYRYAPLGEISVAVGDAIAQGQQLGTMGDVGASGNVHLHLEIRESGEPIDPMSFLWRALLGL